MFGCNKTELLVLSTIPLAVLNKEYNLHNVISNVYVLQGIVVYLVKMLGRTNLELLILATIFLKKLSIYQENKDQMAACDALPHLSRLMATDNEMLLMAVLRLLHNLSFDNALKDEMVKQGVLPRVCNSLSIVRVVELTSLSVMYKASLLMVVLRLLQNLSCDSTFKDDMVKQSVLPRAGADPALHVYCIVEVACLLPLTLQSCVCCAQLVSLHAH